MQETFRIRIKLVNIKSVRFAFDLLTMSGKIKTKHLSTITPTCLKYTGKVYTSLVGNDTFMPKVHR